MAYASAEFDPYAVLGVTDDATQEEIELAWRRALRATHPDCNPRDTAAERRVKEVLRAGEVLRDPMRRACFDRTVAYGRRPRPERADTRRARRATWTTLAWNGGRSDVEQTHLPGGLTIIHRRD